MEAASTGVVAGATSSVVLRHYLLLLVLLSDKKEEGSGTLNKRKRGCHGPRAKMTSCIC